MSKHTRGPWEVSHGGHGSPHGFVIDEYYVLNRTVADDVAIAGDIVDPATQMPSEANARLIAAAPTQHEEMLRYLPIIERAEADAELWERLTEGTGIATANGYRAAIAKATGE